MSLSDSLSSVGSIDSVIDFVERLIFLSDLFTLYEAFLSLTSVVLLLAIFSILSLDEFSSEHVIDEDLLEFFSSRSFLYSVDASATILSVGFKFPLTFLFLLSLNFDCSTYSSEFDENFSLSSISKSVRSIVFDDKYNNRYNVCNILKMVSNSSNYPMDILIEYHSNRWIKASPIFLSYIDHQFAKFLWKI
ncbi:hypothetical protein V1478_015590 [Vespula squamosa]|uniref:Uncharacterized protein n=1 Tax=Vespula squamosa TaxID=30214 RepID=A0ABD2A1B1_VESSQ